MVCLFTLNYVKELWCYRHAACEYYIELFPNKKNVQIDVGHEAQALQHVMRFLPRDAPGLQDPRMEIQQATLLASIYSKVTRFLMEQADVVGQARLRTFAASGADGWLRARPALGSGFVAHQRCISEILFLCGWEFHVLSRVMLVIFATKIWMLSDTMFSIAWDMGTNRPRTILKNAIFYLALQAGARPSSEPMNLLPTDPRIRPADVLVMEAPQILQSSRRRFPRVAPGCSGDVSFEISSLGSGSAGITRT